MKLQDFCCFGRFLGISTCLGSSDRRVYQRTTYVSRQGREPGNFLGRPGLMSMYICKYQVSGGWIHIIYLVKILIPNHESKKILLNELPTVDGSKIPLTSWYGKNYPIILQWYFTSQMVCRISSIHSTIHNHQPHLLLPSLHQFLDQRLPRPWAFKSSDRRP